MSMSVADKQRTVPADLEKTENQIIEKAEDQIMSLETIANLEKDIKKKENAEKQSVHAVGVPMLAKLPCFRNRVVALLSFLPGALWLIPGVEARLSRYATVGHSSKIITRRRIVRTVKPTTVYTTRRTTGGTMHLQAQADGQASGGGGGGCC